MDPSHHSFLNASNTARYNKQKPHKKGIKDEEKRATYNSCNFHLYVVYLNPFIDTMCMLIIYTILFQNLFTYLPSKNL